MGRNAKIKQRRREARLNKRLEFLLHPNGLRHLRKAILAAGARPDSCIFSTRVLKKLCAEWEIPFRPLSVRTLIYNPIFADYMRSVGHYDLSLIPREKVDELGEAGGRFVFLGMHEEDYDGPLPEDKWAGHLVGLVGRPGNQFVVDLSVDQAHRPGKNINVNTPTAFAAHERFLQGEDTIVGSAPHGLLFCYEVKPGDKSYVETPDWTKEPDLDLGISKQEIEAQGDRVLASL